MRSGAASLLLLALGAGCAAPRPYGEGVTFHTLLSGGYRGVNHDLFEGHPLAALEFATRAPESGWGYEIGASYGTEDEGGPFDHEAEFDEYSLGLRRSWETERGARPYVGFGGSLTRIEHRLHDPRTEFEDEGAGAYAHGGILWSLGRFDFDRGTEVLLGFDVRGLVADDHDYAQIALVLGFGR